MIHTMIHIRDCDTGAIVWACPACDYVCISYDGRTTPIKFGNTDVYHAFPGELTNDVPDHATEHEFKDAMISVFDEFDAYYQKYGDIINTAFFEWVVEHRKELENL